MQSHLSPHRIDQLRGVVPDAILEDDFHLFDLVDIRSGIAVNDD